MRDNDYRKRFFEKYITTQWKFMEEISPESYKILAKVFKAHYSPFLPADKSAAIVDLACGPGHLLHYLQSQGYANSRGIDLGVEQLEIAKKMGVKNVEVGDLFDFLKSYKGKFDLIIASQVIEHMRKEEALDALDLIYSALKPGGHVWVMTPNAIPLQGLISAFCDFTHEIIFNSKSLSQLLRVCNFQNVQVAGLGPTGYDLRSHVRAFLFRILKKRQKMHLAIEYGIGRSIWSARIIFEPILLGIGQK